MSIEDIIKEFQNGNRYVINELPQHVDKLVYSVCRKYTFVDDIEDLYQIAWVRLMRCLYDFDINKGVKFTTYLYKILNFYLMNVARDTKKFRNDYDGGNITTQFVSIDFGDEMSVEATIPSDYDIEWEIEYRDKMRIFHKYINTLSDRDKSIMLMRLEDRTYEEISKLLKCPKSTVHHVGKKHQERLFSIFERGVA